MAPNTRRGFQTQRRQNLRRALKRNTDQKKRLIKALKRNPNQKRRHRLVDLAKASQKNRTRLTRPPSSTSTVAPSTHLVGGDLNQDLSRPQEQVSAEDCWGCKLGTNDISCHLKLCPWEPETGSRREWVREMFDEFEDADRIWFIRWIRAYRREELRWVLDELDDDDRDWIWKFLL